MKDQPLDYEPVRRSPISADSSVKVWSPAVSGIGGKPSGDQSEIPKESTIKKADPIEPVSIGVIRRGHFLSYLGLFLFTAVIYFRPYELIPALRGATTMTFWIAVATLAIFVFSQFTVEGNLTARPREVKLILLLAVTALLSVPFADDKTRSWNAFSDYLKVIVMFVVMVNVVRTRWRLQGLLFLALAVSCFLSANAFLDYGAGIFKSDGYRVVGVIGNMFSNPNDLALHLVTIAPIAIGLSLGARNIFLKMVYGLAALGMVGAITLTYSRGGFLGLAAAAIFLAWRLARRQRVLTVAAMAIAIVLFISLAPGGYGTRVSGIVGQHDGSATARTDDLKRSVLVMLRHPLLGVGIDNYVLRSNNNTATHNAYTQIGAEMGVFAMVLYTLLVISPFKRLRQIERETVESRRKDARFYYLAVGLQASLIGYMVSSFFASVSYLWNVYYLVGYAFCLHRMYVARLGSPIARDSHLILPTPQNRPAHGPDFNPLQEQTERVF